MTPLHQAGLSSVIHTHKVCESWDRPVSKPRMELGTGPACLAWHWMRYGSQPRRGKEEDCVRQIVYCRVGWTY